MIFEATTAAFVSLAMDSNSRPHFSHSGSKLHLSGSRHDLHFFSSNFVEGLCIARWHYLVDSHYALHVGTLDRGACLHVMLFRGCAMPPTPFNRSSPHRGAPIKLPPTIEAVARMVSFAPNWPLAAPRGPGTARNQHRITVGSSGLP